MSASALTLETAATRLLEVSFSCIAVIKINESAAQEKQERVLRCSEAPEKHQAGFVSSSLPQNKISFISNNT